MKKIFLLFTLLLIAPLLLAQTTYYSSDGNPANDLNSWWTNANGTGSHPANFNNSSDTFIIQSAHIISTTGNWTVSGSVVIDGWLNALNQLSVGNLQVSSTGTYEHNLDGGTIPSATCQSGSKCLIAGVMFTLPIGFNQSFSNFEWSSPNAFAVAINPTAIGGDLTISGGGSGTFGISASSFTVGGNLDISASTANFLIPSGNTITLSGNFSMSNGTLTISNSGTSNLIIGGNFTQSGGTITTGGSAGQIQFNSAGTHTYTQSGGTISGTVNFIIGTGAILAPDATSIIGGSGTLSGGGVVQVVATGNADDFGTQYTLSKTLTNLTVEYKGGSSQNAEVTNYGGLKINNSSGVTLTGTSTVGGTLTLTLGALSVGNSNTFNINGAISTVSGSLNGGTNSTISIGGTGASTNLPAVTIQNLTMNRANGIALGGNVTVNGTLTLTSGILTTSGFNLTAASTSGGSSSSFVSGALSISGGAATENFPIGKGSDYRPVELTGVTGTTGSTVISAESFNTGSGGTATAPLINLSSVSYWFIQVTTATFSSATVTVTYDATDGVTDYTHLGLGQSSAKSGSYQNYSGTLGGSGNGSGTISTDGPVLTLGYFALGNITNGTNPLPVELSSFTATVSGSTVNLKWETATEVNNYGFDVERSVDSKTWTKLGFVAGAGNSSSPKSYSFKDQPDGGASFSYRLKQIDVGGAYKYYDPISVSLSGGDKAQLMQNSPNPFNPSTAIKYYVPQAVDVTITIYDVLGREVTKLVNSQVEAGYHVVYWNGRDRFGNAAASGIYIYRLKAGNFNEIKKMNLLK